MRFWWVNHKQTYRQETGGRYIWPPKTNRTGARNQSYDNMRRVLTGDIVFSYAQAEIRQLGIVTRPAASCPKPVEFGKAGTNWAHDGWMVPVDWHPIPQPLRPKELIADLRAHLPAKYSPLNPVTGYGAQNIYLAALPDGMAEMLLSRLGGWAAELLRVAQVTGDDDGAVREVDDALEGEVRNDRDLDETTRRAVIEARRGQGRFRLSVEALEHRCRISGVSDPRLLRASHIKPWRPCSSTAERLDGNNGLLLCPNVDHLFDRGYISFGNKGDVLVSPLIDAAQVALLGVATAAPLQVGRFNSRQTGYLAFHRCSVFLHGQ